MTTATNAKIGSEADTHGKLSADHGKGEHANLTYRYGTIGIQAVAAAARYVGVRTSQAQATDARIDQRFVESAV